MNVIEKEPVTIWVSIGALVSALLFNFVPDIDNGLVSAIVDVVVLVGPIFAGIVYARSKVTPVAKVEAERNENLRA